MKKKRADELLYEHGHCDSIADAALLILEGKVRSKPDALVRKASELFPADTVLLVDAGTAFVSRGAHKLEKALDRFAPRLDGKIAIDIGASTGGFTDLMLSRGAAKVYAVDVGRGLLHWKLRTDPRVVCLEGVNARSLPPDTVPGGADLLSMDVSFISATKILPAAAAVLKPGALAFILVKPQFEAPKHDVPPGGVVTDPAVRRNALEKVCNAAAGLGWSLLDASDSPLRGPRGNLEMVAVFRTPEGPAPEKEGGPL
ncbi:MAG: TlyA family RNA methyltransferase [Lentisphaeria bacterium]|nr:TlyA family RNA methyltransferase [Lentisphaeria bacterium]